MTGWRALVVALLLAPVPALGASSLPAAALAGLGFDQHPGAALPRDAVLRDEAGAPLRFGALVGARPLVLVFDYFRCTTLCGLVLGDLAATLAEVPLDPGRDYGVVAVSIDPTETPADAARLKARHFASDRRFAAAARFLTGDAAEVGRLADAVGFRYRYDPALGQYAHPAGLVLVTPQGTIARYLPGVAYAPLDLRLGLVEASRGTIASPSAHLLLLCYGYDPAQGRYSALVGRLMQLVGLASMTVVGLVVLRATRRPPGPR